MDEKYEIQENVHTEQVKNLAERMDGLMVRVHELEWQWLPMDKGGKDGNLPDVIQDIKKHP